MRLRCRPELYEDQYDTAEFNVFLTKLAEVGLMFAKGIVKEVYEETKQSMMLGHLQ